MYKSTQLSIALMKKTIRRTKPHTPLISIDSLASYQLQAPLMHQEHLYPAPYQNTHHPTTQSRSQKKKACFNERQQQQREAIQHRAHKTCIFVMSITLHRISGLLLMFRRSISEITTLEKSTLVTSRSPASYKCSERREFPHPGTRI